MWEELWESIWLDEYCQYWTWLINTWIIVGIRIDEGYFIVIEWLGVGLLKTIQFHSGANQWDIGGCIESQA